MKVNVGSLNPVKINSTKHAFSRYFDDVSVSGVEVDSGVGDMPFGDDKLIEGAINRAKAAIGDADFGVGLEGGVEETAHGMFLFGWVAIIDSQGNIGLGSDGRFLLPGYIADRIRRGEELGPVMDDIKGDRDIKKKQGAIGIFTKGEIDRTQSFERGVILALVRFINPDEYSLRLEKQ